MSLLSTGLPAPLPNALSDIHDLEPFSKVELVVLDLDGTLLGHVDDRPDVTTWSKRYRLVDRLKFRGVQLTLATGRAFEGARAAMSAVSRQKNTPFVLYNGSAVITSAGVLLTHRALNKASIAGLAEAVNRAGGCALMYWLRADFSGRLEREWAVFVGKGKPPEREFNGLPISDDVDVPTNASCVAALLWTDDAGGETHLLSEVSQVPGLSITVSGGRYIEVRPTGSSKAAGLGALLDHLRISQQHVMAIGDNDNDVELLQAVGVSVCVANASEQARAASRFQTTYPSSSGTIETLELVTRARRLWAGRTPRYE